MAPGVRAQVVPGSMEVRQAEEEVSRRSSDAGRWQAAVRSASRPNDDILEAGVPYASTRQQLRGRQGEAPARLVSPRCAAAAVTGRFTDWRRL
ncbi:MAG: hypothetical protein ACLUHG_00085 [Sutterella wadsworthensis]